MRASPAGRAAHRPMWAGRDLFVEWYGSGVALSHRDDQPYLVWQLLASIAEASPDVLIRHTSQAGLDPAVDEVLRAVVREAAGSLAGRPDPARAGRPAPDGTDPPHPAGLRLGALDLGRPVELDPGLVATLGAEAGGRLIPVVPLCPAADAPPMLAQGWSRQTDRLYRQSGPDGPVAVAEVLPAGILLRPAGLYAQGAAARFDPRQWTIIVGRAGLPVPPAVVAMLRRLLLDAGGGIPLILAGEADRAARRELAALAEEADVPLDAGATAALPPEPTRVVPAPARHDAPPATPADGPAPPVPVASAGPTPAPAAAARPAPPVITMVDPDTAPESLDEPSPGHAAQPAVETAGFDEGVGNWQAATPAGVDDRASTGDEQRRFAQALGGRFNNLLAVVNAALATWPVLRRDGTQASKADYVAVCLYMGTSEEGGPRLNRALRAGGTTALDGYLPCLISGIRQLPLHRRAVVSQGRLGGPAERLYPVGAVITEAGFWNASVTADVAVKDADVDFVIWPRTARQAYVLVSDRGVDEAVFGMGSRFKVLAVDTGPVAPPSESGVRAPETAVLLRELLPDERPATRELDDADRAALGRLGGVLRERRAQPLRTVDDPDVVDRLAGSALGYVPAQGAAGW